MPAGKRSGAGDKEPGAGAKRRFLRKPLFFRMKCVLVMATMFKAVGGVEEPNFAAANKVMRQYLKEYNNTKPQQEQLIVSPGTWYLRTYWGEFCATGSVGDLPRAPKSNKVPDAAALRAASLVKQGKWQREWINGKNFDYLTHYTSIEQACEECAELEEIRVDHDATYAQLLTAMHRADPSLVFRRIFFKHALTATEMLERQGFGADMLAQFLNNSSLPTNTIFIDEASFVLSEKTRSDVHVWCDKYDLCFTDVCPVQHHKGDAITVRWVAAVTAHPAFEDKRGLVYFEFTTGTTDIHRRVNTKLDGNTTDHTHAYTKHNEPTTPAQHTTREEFEDNLYHIVKAWQAKTTDPFFLSYDNASIQATADISTLYNPHYPGDAEHAIHIDPAVTRIKVPPYSHDINKVIEHVFGTMKHKIREAVYFKYKMYNTAAKLQQLVWELFHTKIPEHQVEKDVASLPLLWEVLSIPFGVMFVKEDGTVAVGTGGNWPNAQYR